MSAALAAVDKLLHQVDQQDTKEQEPSSVQVPQHKLNHANSNVSMPAIGFGLYNVTETDLERVTIDALQAGYRHFDGASFYKNEAAFGRILSKNKIARNEVFITSKVWNDMQGYEQTLASFEQSLKDLCCEYIDLYLVHWPVPNKHCDTWRAVEKLYRDRKCRAIGVSNYLQQDFEELLQSNANNKNFIKPSVNQLCLNPLYYQPELLQYFQVEHKMVVQAYKPLERADDALLKHAKIVEMSNKHKVSPAQVCLKWGFQHGFVELVKSNSAQRMKENMNALFLPDFSKQDLQYLDSITTKENVANWHKRYTKRKTGI